MNLIVVLFLGSENNFIVLQTRKTIDLFKCEGQKLETDGLRAKPILFGPVHFLFGLHIYLMCCQLF